MWRTPQSSRGPPQFLPLVPPLEGESGIQDLEELLVEAQTTEGVDSFGSTPHDDSLVGGLQDRGVLKVPAPRSYTATGAKIE